MHPHPRGEKRATQSGHCNGSRVTLHRAETLWDHKRRLMIRAKTDRKHPSRRSENRFRPRVRFSREPSAFKSILHILLSPDSEPVLNKLVFERRLQ
jgi:hypothetical protein